MKKLILKFICTFNWSLPIYHIGQLVSVSSNWDEEILAVTRRYWSKNDNCWIYEFGPNIPMSEERVTSFLNQYGDFGCL